MVIFMIDCCSLHRLNIVNSGKLSIDLRPLDLDFY